MSLKELAYRGDEEVVCVYVDIKTALQKLPFMYRDAIVNALILDKKGYSEDTIDRGIGLMEDILNGR